MSKSAEVFCSFQITISLCHFLVAESSSLWQTASYCGVHTAVELAMQQCLLATSQIFVPIALKLFRTLAQTARRSHAEQVANRHRDVHGTRSPKLPELPRWCVSGKGRLVIGSIEEASVLHGAEHKGGNLSK